MKMIVVKNIQDGWSLTVDASSIVEAEFILKTTIDENYNKDNYQFFDVDEAFKNKGWHVNVHT